MIDYNSLPPMLHMYCMRLLLQCVQEGIPLKIRAATQNEIWVDYRDNRAIYEEKLKVIATRCGLTELENHHYSIPSKL